MSERVYLLAVCGLFVCGFSCIVALALCAALGKPSPESLSASLGACLGSLGTLLLHPPRGKEAEGVPDK